jgi:Fe-S cluster assembly protein SufD
VQAGAKVEHHLWQRAGDATSLVERVEARVGRDATFEGHVVFLGGAWVRVDHNVSLVERGAHASLTGLYLVSGTQHVDNHTRIDHLVPDGSSHELYKGVIGAEGRAVFNGSIVVHKDAQRTDAQLANHNLLLSERARIDAKPELEIYADDVQCAHGTTVGQLDDEALFYMQSRGIPRDTARRVLIAGFVREAVEAVAHDGLRERLEELVNARLAEVQR